MVNKLKVMTIVGTRPEIIRLSQVIRECDRYFDHILVHTEQNWDQTLNEIFFEDLNIREPDYRLQTAGRNPGETIGNIISQCYDIMVVEQPQTLLVLGDTNSTLSVIGAKKLKIPIFHMEAGNRCFDQNVPEETNRKIVDHVSDVNLAYTEHARRYLLNEGCPKEYIFVIGSPMTEVLKKHLGRIGSSGILKTLGLETGKYIVASSHREENLDLADHFVTLADALNHVAEKYNMPVIFSTHPRTRKKIEEKQVVFNPLIKNLKPFGFFDYCKLQKNAYCVLSDSGTLSEEASILHFPAVIIRTSTERPEVLDKGGIVLGGLRFEDIDAAIRISTQMFQTKDQSKPLDYKDTNVSEKVVKIIQSYYKVIKRNIWYEKDYF